MPAMAPRRRLEGDPPPVYGPRSKFFSVGINHGGNFLGSSSNRVYVDGSVIWFDQVDTVTWSPLMVENLVEEIGYEMQGSVNVHYLIPILTMSKNGLRRIRDDHDTTQIVQCVEIGHRFISLYLDHDESTRATNWDDVVQFLVTELPPVISPTKPLQTVQEAGQREDDLIPIQAMFPEICEEDRAARRSGLRPRSKISKVLDAEQAESSRATALSDEDDDPDYVDSEYDLTEDDDDLEFELPAGPVLRF